MTAPHVFYLFLIAIYIIVSISYLVLIIYLYRGWRKLRSYKHDNREHDTLVSVIIPVRNEEHYIKKNLSCITNQSYPADMTEIIVVDDHSDDNTAEAVLSFRKDNIRYIRLEDGKAGKKAALTEGIINSRGTLIVTTDADCTAGHRWIESIVSYYERYKPLLMFGWVRIKSSSLFSVFQSLEHTSTSAVSAGAAGNGKAITLSAANMAFEKELFVSSADPLRKDIASGDDMFLLQRVAAIDPSRIHFVKSKEMIIDTVPEISVRSFLSQRVRWLSKTKHIHGRGIQTIGAITVAMNIAVLAAFIQSIFIPCFLIDVLLPLFLLKCVIDGILLFPTSLFTGNSRLLIFLPIAEIGYSIYVTVVFFFSILPGKILWKGRKYDK